VVKSPLKKKGAAHLTRGTKQSTQRNMIKRYKSEDYPHVFIPSHSFEGDLSSENGVFTFDNLKENPQPDFPYLVRVGGGYQAFTTKRHALTFYKED
jgi:hypothetical protein